MKQGVYLNITGEKLAIYQVTRPFHRRIITFENGIYNLYWEDYVIKCLKDWIYLGEL